MRPYAALLCFPEPLFSFSVRADSLILHSDRPQWVREGYADYVGKGDSFHYDEAKRAFLAGAPEMDWSKSGLYWRFNLLVAYVLDHRGWSVMQLLNDPPQQETIEAEIRAGS